MGGTRLFFASFDVTYDTGWLKMTFDGMYRVELRWRECVGGWGLVGRRGRGPVVLVDEVTTPFDTVIFCVKTAQMVALTSHAFEREV